MALKVFRIICLIMPVMLTGMLAGALGQVTDPDPDSEVIRIDTQLIMVPFTVVDRLGKPVRTVKRGDITLFEDGVKQDVEEFMSVAAPFEVVLLLDTSGSARSELDLIRRSAQGFISSLRDGDRVAIMGFRTEERSGKNVAAGHLLTGLTDDREKLKNALEGLQTSNGTPYYDALSRIASDGFPDEIDRKTPRRRAVVILSDGVDSTSEVDLDAVRPEFEELGAAVYFIRMDTRDYFEEHLLYDCVLAMRFSSAQIRRYYDGFGRGSKIERVSDFCKIGDFEKLAISKRLYEIADAEMEVLAEMSGGRIFPAADLNDARNAFAKVADEIGMSYSLGYYSSNTSRDGKFRKIKLEIKGLPAGAVIRARNGYNAEAK
ncbi:MAG: VWA domain-containing protein [Acidobacteria bacterium]|nr:VWA domain-containing protein [Acidobacteriota bacterium]